MYLGTLEAHRKTKSQACLAEPPLHFTLPYLFSGNFSTVPPKLQRWTLPPFSSPFLEGDPWGQSWNAAGRKLTWQLLRFTETVAGTRDFIHSNIFKKFQLKTESETCFISGQQIWTHRAALLKLLRRHSRKPSPSSFGCTQGSKTRCLLGSTGMTRHSAIFVEFWQHLLMIWKPF